MGQQETEVRLPGPLRLVSSAPCWSRVKRKKAECETQSFGPSTTGECVSGNNSVKRFKAETVTGSHSALRYCSTIPRSFFFVCMSTSGFFWCVFYGCKKVIIQRKKEKTSSKNNPKTRKVARLPAELDGLFLKLIKHCPCHAKLTCSNSLVAAGQDMHFFKRQI